MVALRELRQADAAALLAAIGSDEVSRFISPPPPTVDGFERFIAWERRERASGLVACFAVVPHGADAAVGLFQIRRLDTGSGPGSPTAEWGFALGSGVWSTGMFMDGAALALRFVFDVMRVHRLEARAAVANGRGNAALRKVGAVREGVLRKALWKDGEYLDQALWSVLDEDWRRGRQAAPRRVARGPHRLAS